MYIYFRLQNEFLYFKSLVTRDCLIVKEMKKRHNCVLHLNELADEQLLRYFIDVYLMYRLESRIQDIVAETYYYTNQEDIDHIVAWTISLLEDESFNEQYFKTSSLAQFLYLMTSEQLMHLPSTRSHIYFDSFVLFQLKTFHNQLSDIVGYAIDEMKREEEHQHFLEMARTFVQNQAPQTPLLHIINEGSFHFYNQFGKYIRPTTLSRCMKQTPLYLFGLDESELTVAPVLALMPRKIEIYGREVNDSKIITLMKIFEERVQLYPFSQFPFAISHHGK